MNISIKVIINLIYSDVNNAHILFIMIEIWNNEVNTMIEIGYWLVDRSY